MLLFCVPDTTAGIAFVYLQPLRVATYVWGYLCTFHDDVIKWKHFPRNWPFVRGIHRSPVNSPHKGQWRGALMFSLIYVWINGWVNNREAGDLRRYLVHYDVTVMLWPDLFMESEYIFAISISISIFLHSPSNKVWWLCLVPTSTTRFANDVECRKFDIVIQGKKIWAITSNSVTENEEHDIRSQILKTMFGLHASVIFGPQYVWFPVHLLGPLIPLWYQTLVVNWQY